MAVLVSAKRRCGWISIVWQWSIPLIIKTIRMRFDRCSNWMVIRDFCCSVSGLTHFSQFIINPDRQFAIWILQIIHLSIHSSRYQCCSRINEFIMMIRHSMSMEIWSCCYESMIHLTSSWLDCKHIDLQYMILAVSVNIFMSRGIEPGQGSNPYQVDKK